MIDFVKCINDSLSNLSADERQMLLNDFCLSKGYTIKLPEGGTVLKKDFMNEHLKNYIKDSVNNYRRGQKIIERDTKEIVYEKLEFII